ncbi:MAG TPA: phosphoglycerate dehydrogenase [Terriglobia bacterium]|nr:phosphoglycerate dehydrogenase [Terriglobia bacterium]
MKIVIADDVSKKGIEMLRAVDSSWQVVDLGHEKGDTAARKQRLLEEIPTAEALIVRSATKATAQLLDQAARLRVIGRAGVGVDNVDLDAATRKGVVVMNTPGGNAESVAEHTLALMLALARRIPQADASIKQGKWEKKAFLGRELRGKALGLVGFGRIGAEVARRAQALEMQVSAYDPHIAPRLAAEQNVKLVPSAEELFASSDFISLHASATAETRHLVNAKTLGAARPGVRIINCARGELVDEAALLAALQSGQVGGAGLDVFEPEPPKDPALVGHANVIATPHIAGSTEEAQEIVGIRIAEQVRDYLVDGVVRNAVNLPPVSAEEYRRLRPYLVLGEKLGTFLVQIAPPPLEEIRISYDGGVANLNTHLVKSAVLAGVLGRTLSDEEVNLVNAASLAASRGLEVTEVRSSNRATASNSLGVALRGAGGTVSVLGAVGLRDSMRVLGLNEVDVEAPLKGAILVIQNQDVPGVIGRVGTLLGERKINIGSFALGRHAESHQAIGLVNVDQSVPAATLAELRAIPAVRSALLVEIE